MMSSYYGASTRQGVRFRNASGLFERYQVVRILLIVWGKSALEELVFEMRKRSEDNLARKHRFLRTYVEHILE